MLTLKKVKELVNAPAHTKRVPSPKVLLEEGRIFLRKEFEHGSHLTLYHNGYVWFSAGKRNTVFHFYMVEKAAWLYRHCNGDSVVDRLMVLFMNFGLAYKSVLPSFHPFDLMVGLVGAAALKAVIYFKGKNAKKYRQGEEYGSARWSA